MAASKFHVPRRTTQIATLSLMVLVPVTGLFRIDLAAGRFILLNRQVCWSDFSLMFGPTIMVIAAGVIMYSTIGRAWCGWACPQNTISEWADGLTRRLLGRHASVDIDDRWLQVAASRNKAANWTKLGLSFLGASLVLGLIPLFFFYAPSELWPLITFSANAHWSRFLMVVYFISVMAALSYVVYIRHLWCFACPYRFGQFIFRSRHALHVAFDVTRAGDCVKCNYCATSCVIGIEPTRIQAADGCINCGECIDACDRMHRKHELAGLLRFSTGRDAARGPALQSLAQLLSQVGASGALFAAGTALTVWGLVHYSPRCWL